MEPPKVGIFYLLNGRVFAETVPVATVEPSVGVRTYHRQHHDFWSELQKKHPDLSDLDCYALPRGRVTYHETSRKFEILADPHVFKDEDHLASVIEVMHLKSSTIEVRGDEDYRCAVCRNGGVVALDEGGS